MTDFKRILIREQHELMIGNLAAVGLLATIAFIVIALAIYL